MNLPILFSARQTGRAGTEPRRRCLGPNPIRLPHCLPLLASFFLLCQLPGAPTLGWCVAGKELEVVRFATNRQEANEDSSAEENELRGERLIDEIATDEQSLRAYLDTIIPNDEKRESVDRWLAQLSDADYQTREDATQQLIIVPFLSASRIQSARDSASPEALWRLNQIRQERLNNRSEARLLLVLDYLEEHPFPGLIGPLIRLASISGSVYLEDQIVQTATANVDSANLQAVWDTSHDPDDAVRAVAIKVLGSLPGDVDGKPAVAQLLEFSDDPSPRVRLAVAESLAQSRNRDCLPLLLEILEEPDPLLADRAAGLLRASTHQYAGFAASQPHGKKQEAIKLWRDWLAKNGATCVLHGLNQKTMFNRTLVTSYVNGQIYELDREFDVRWSADLPNAFACQGLENGHRLVSQFSQGRVVEFDTEGNICWEVDGLPANVSGVSRTSTGTTLVAAGQSGGKILELNADGETIWELTMDGSPAHVMRLESGLHLVCLMTGQKICEVDHEGNLMWQLELEGKPYYAERLANGNTLVRLSEYGSIEYTREGRKVWSYQAGPGYHAQRLPDGTTLVSSHHGLQFISADGELLEQCEDYTGFINAHRY